MASPRIPRLPASPGDRLPAGVFARVRRRRATRTVELPLPPADQAGPVPNVSPDHEVAAGSPAPQLAVGPLVRAPRPFRRVTIHGTHVGKAYSLADVQALWSRYGLSDAEPPEPQRTRWEGGGPNTWPIAPRGAADPPRT